MRSRWIGAALVLTALSVLTSGAPTDKGTGPRKPGAAGTPEQEVLDELNLARQKPQEYAKLIREFRARFKGDNSYSIGGGVSVTTQEGVKAVDEAIAFLDKAKPVRPLEHSPGLSLAARDHVNDMGPSGAVGHTGTDGSDAAARIKRYGEWDALMGENIAFGHKEARMIVIQLIVDDGVPSRGHRANIFQEKFKTVGLACGSHKTFRHMCVMDFAGGFRENKAAREITRKEKK